MDLHTFKVVECGNETFRINTDFQGDTLSLIVLKGLKAWSAKVNMTEMEHLAKTFQLSPQDYFDSLKEYFTIPLENIELKLENDLLVMYHIKEKFNLKYFTWKMLEVDFQDCVNQLLERFYVNWDELKLQTAKDSNNIAELTKRNSELETKLDDFVERKQKDVQTLLTNFCLVLNEKKRQIQHLNELLLAFRKGRPTVNPPPPIKTKNIKTEAVELKSTVSDSEPEEENNSEYNTDEEETTKKDFNENLEASKPSTSRIRDETDGLELTTLPKRQKVDEKVGNNGKRFTFAPIKKTVRNERKEVVVKEENDIPISINVDTQDLMNHIN